MSSQEWPGFSVLWTIPETTEVSFPIHFPFKSSLPLPDSAELIHTGMPVICRLVRGFGNSEINKIPFKFSTLKRAGPALLGRISLAGKRNLSPGFYSTL